MRAVFPAELVVYESAVDSLWQMGGMGQYIYVHVVDAEQAVAEGAAPFFKYNNELKEALYGHDYHRHPKDEIIGLFEGEIRPAIEKLLAA